MDPKTTVKALMEAFQMGDFEKAQSLVSDDCLYGPALSIISMVLAWPWMDMGTRLKAAFPDLDYHLNIVNVDGNIVKFSTQIKGTQNGNLDLTVTRMGVFPATNKSLATAREYGIATVRDGKVVSWLMESTKSANLITILEQLGVKPRSL